MLNDDARTPGNSASRGSGVTPQSSSEKLATVVKALIVSFAIATAGVLPQGLRIKILS
jgi:hypothetical protein